MRLSTSIPERDLQTLDDCVRELGLLSRSAAVQRAVGLLRQSTLERDNAAAWRDWASDGDESAWDASTGDGFDDASR